MQINGVSETEYLQELYNKKRLEEQQKQTGTSGQFDGMMDQLILASQETDQSSAMNSGTYNSQGFSMYDMDNGMPPAPPVRPEEMNSTETVEDTTTEEETAETDTITSLQNILDQISQTMRVNQDSILTTLDDLGLSVTDLYNSDNMSLLCNALDEKAGEMGLTQAEDLESNISSLTTAADDEKSSLMSSYSLDDEELQALLEQIEEMLTAGQVDTTTATETDSETATLEEV